MNSDRWKVSVYGQDGKDEIDIVVPYDTYTLDYAEDIAETILRFVASQRKERARLQ